MNKKIYFIIPFLALIFIFSFSLVACNGRSKTSSTTKKPKEEIIENVEEGEIVEEAIIKDEGAEEESKAEEELPIEPDKSIFLSNKNLDDSFIGLSLLEVQQLQQESGWPPSFPFDPSKAKEFTAKVSKAQVFDKDDNPKEISLIVFNLPIGTEIIAPIEGALAFGGGSFSGDGKGGNNIYIGLNNILGRIEFSYFLKEPMQPIDMDKLQPKIYNEGSVLLKIDNENTTTDFGIVYPDDPGNLVMVMRESCEEYECPLMSIDFNSFLKDEEGYIVYILNQ